MPFDQSPTASDAILCLLDAGKEIVRHSWHKGSLSDGGKFCAAGAIWKAKVELGLSEEQQNAAIMYLRRAVPEAWMPYGVGPYNDCEYTTLEDVLSLYDRAIDLRRVDLLYDRAIERRRADLMVGAGV